MSEPSPAPIVDVSRAQVEADDQGAGHLGPVVTVPAVSRRTLGLLAIASPIVVVVVLGITHRWTYDDGFAYFRVIDQIFAGNGPVFNVGERVESFISPMWVAALALGELISPLRLEHTAAVLSLTFTVVGIGLAAIGSDRMAVEEGDDRPVMVPLGVLAFAVLWPVWVWATGGTEIGLTIAWLGLCSFLLARWARAPRTAPVGAATLVVLGLGWLVRPEMSAVSALFVGAVVLTSAKTTGARVRSVLVAVAIPGAYQLFRMGYYGLVTSSASVAREDTTPRPGFGWDYFVDFVSPYLLLIPIVAIALGVYRPLFARLVETRDVRRTVAVAIQVAAGITDVVIVIVIVGGDAAHGRLLLPALFLMLAPVFVVPARRRYAEALAVTAVWAICCGTLMRPPDDGGSRPFTNAHPGPGLTYEDVGVESRGVQPWMDGPGFYMASPFAPAGERVDMPLNKPDAVVVATESGAVAYALGTEVHVLDLNGAADPLIGHQRLEHRLLPGHEKWAYAPWIIARFGAVPATVAPDALTLTPQFWGTTPPLQFLEDVQWAASALECGPLARLQEAYSEPLGAGQFFSNIWNAMSNTSLRFATMPRRVHAFDRCGRGTPDNVLAYWERIQVGGQLATDPEPGDLAIAGRCGVVFRATADPDEPWAAIDARDVRATISLDPADTDAGLAAAFVIAPLGPDGASVVWIETDGDGNFRVTQTVSWYPPTQTAWAPIDPQAPVDVSVEPNLSQGRWVTVVDGNPLSSVPMLGASGDDAGPLIASTPVRAAPGSAYPAIDHIPAPISRTCQSIAAQHPGPSAGGHGTMSVVTWSVT